MVILDETVKILIVGNIYLFVFQERNYHWTKNHASIYKIKHMQSKYKAIANYKIK